MTEGASLMAVLLGLVKAIGPFWLFMLVGGPLGLMIGWGYVNMRWVDRRDERFQARLNEVLTQNQQSLERVLGEFRQAAVNFESKYDANVVLVKETQNLTGRVIRMAEESSSVVVLNTQILTKLAERIEHNLFCPIVTGRIDLRELARIIGQGGQG